MTTVLAPEQYVGELSAARARLFQFKSRLSARALQRKGDFSKTDLARRQEDGTSREEAKRSEELAAAALQKLIAKCLLTPGATVPMDSVALQKKLANNPETATLLDELLRASGQPNIEQALRDMGGGNLPALEAEDFDMNGKNRIMILSTNVARLTAMTVEVVAPQPPMPPGLPGPPGMHEHGPPRPPMGNFPPQGIPPMMGGGMPFGPHPGGGHFGPMQGGGFGMPHPPPGGPGPHFNQGRHGPHGQPFPHGNMGPPPPAMPMGPPPPPGAMGHLGHMGQPPGMGPPPGMMGLPMGPPPGMPPQGMPMQGFGGAPGGPGPRDEVNLDALLNRQSIRARQAVEKVEKIQELLKPSAKESKAVEKFRTEGGTAIREFCPDLTKEDCCRVRMAPFPCGGIHYKRVIYPWTDMSLGNCSYLDTCRHLKNCRHVHYELDDEAVMPTPGSARVIAKPPVPNYLAALPEAQWLNTDIRKLDMSVLGKFGVIMADPPWEIHQDLPYGTMADQEMRDMKIGELQDDGVIFLWVTGRAMELGRECLDIWGYKRVDELIWVKTNQLQRLIRTGRTGHWLNHSKEHCLVGIKGNPAINRNLECDVVVAEVRETSRKPDEMYSLLERISPGTRKVEIFARNHNLKPGWVSLGNQLPGIKIVDPEMLARYEAAYGPIPEDAASAAAAFDPSSIT